MNKGIRKYIPRATDRTWYMLSTRFGPEKKKGEGGGLK